MKRSAAGLLRELLVLERDLATDRLLERGGGHLARHGLPALARPLVEPPRLARRDDRDLVLVAAGGRYQRGQLHGSIPPRCIGSFRSAGASGAPARVLHPRSPPGGAPRIRDRR